MKKLWKLGVAFVILAVLFAGCGKEEKTVKPVAPSITGVAIDFTGDLGVAKDGTGAAIAPEGEVTFKAEVTGKNGRDKNGKAVKFNANYEITIDDLTLFDTETPPYSGTGPRTLKVKADADIGSTFNVEAVSVANSTQKDGMSVEILADEDIAHDYVKDIKLEAYSTAAMTGTPQTLTAMTRGSVWYVKANVETVGDADDTYVINVTDTSGIVTVEAVGDTAAKKITVGDKGGTFKIRATPNEPITLVEYDEWTITVQGAAGPEPELNDPWFDDAAWKIYNLKPENLDPLTTTTVTGTDGVAALQSGRYVIYNNESDALIEAASAVTTDGAKNTGADRVGIRNATFFYLDKPFVADLANFEAYGIQAQFRITDDAVGVTTWPATERLVLMAAFTDPEAYVQSLGSDNLIANPEDVPSIAGIRRSNNGHMRGVVTRQYPDYRDLGGITLTQADGIGAATSANVPNSTESWQIQFNGADFGSSGPTTGYTATKLDGFRDQDFTFRLIRTNVGNWLMYIISPDGQSQLMRSSVFGTEKNDAMTGADPHYFGFVIAGLKVEISNIKFFRGGTAGTIAFLDQEPTWEDKAVKGQQPATVEAKRVVLSSAAVTGVPQVPETNLTILDVEFGASQVLSARITPYSASQAIQTWSIKEADATVMTVAAGNSSHEGRVTRVGLGKRTIVAAPQIGGVSGEFSIDILQGASEVDSVTLLNPPAEPVYVGFARQFRALVAPNNAPQTVAWKVTTDEAGNTPATAYAVINANTGSFEVTGGQASAETKVWVHATSALPAAGGGSNVGKVEITIRATSAAAFAPQIWHSAVTMAQPADAVSVGPGNEVLTLKGAGRFNNANSEWGFVYLPVTADFTMTVKMNVTAWADTNNATRAGILVIPKGTIEVNATTGALTNVPTGTGLVSQAVHIRADLTYGVSSRLSGGNTNWDGSDGVTAANSQYLRLRRHENQIYGAFSADGITWVDRATRDVATGLTDDMLVGLFVGGNASSGTAPSTAQFSDLRFVSGAGAGAENAVTAPVDFKWLAP